MKKLLFLTMALGFFLFIGCSVNEKEDLQPNVKTEVQEIENNGNAPTNNTAVTERAPCAFQYQFTTTNLVTISGDFSQNCSSFSYPYCGVSKYGLNLSAPSGSGLWMNSGRYAVRNANTQAVTFRIKTTTQSTWVTNSIPAFGGEIYLYAYRLTNGNWLIVNDPTPPC